MGVQHSGEVLPILKKKILYDMEQVNKTLGFHDLSYEKC